MEKMNKRHEPFNRILEANYEDEVDPSEDAIGIEVPKHTNYSLQQLKCHKTLPELVIEKEKHEETVCTSESVTTEAKHWTVSEEMKGSEPSVVCYDKFTGEDFRISRDFPVPQIPRSSPKVMAKVHHFPQETEDIKETIIDHHRAVKVLPAFEAQKIEIIRNSDLVMQELKQGKCISKLTLINYEGFLLKQKSGMLARTREVFAKVNQNDLEMMFSLTVRAGDFSKTFTFKVTRRKDFINWVKIIKKNCDNFVPFRSCKPLYPKFWKFRTLSCEDFEAQADTGHILLFTGTGLACKMQRLLTGSRFDHVAMILKLQSNQLIFIDATSNEGVSVCRWKVFMDKEYYRFYDRIVYRPLYFHKTAEKISLLETYLKKVIGKKYALNMLRLLRKHSTMDSVTATEESRGYFCSELVASILKLLRFLPETISSSQYWPGTFSCENNLELQNGATLGNEYLIEFSQATQTSQSEMAEPLLDSRIEKVKEVLMTDPERIVLSSKLLDQEVEYSALSRTAANSPINVGYI